MPPYVSIENHHDWERARIDAGVEHEPTASAPGVRAEPMEKHGRNSAFSGRAAGRPVRLLTSLDGMRRQAEIEPLAQASLIFRAGCRGNHQVRPASRDAFDLEKESPDPAARR